MTMAPMKKAMKVNECSAFVNTRRCMRMIKCMLPHQPEYRKSNNVFWGAYLGILGKLMAIQFGAPIYECHFGRAYLAMQLLSLAM